MTLTDRLILNVDVWHVLGKFFWGSDLGVVLIPWRFVCFAWARVFGQGVGIGVCRDFGWTEMMSVMDMSRFVYIS